MIIKPSFNKAALDILNDRYLWRDDEGKPVETPEQMLVRVATHVAFLGIGMQPLWRWLKTSMAVPPTLNRLWMVYRLPSMMTPDLMNRRVVRKPSSAQAGILPMKITLRKIMPLMMASRM